MSDDGVTLSVDELVEYCRTQARLLAGRTETLGAETDDLLDEIDAEIADLRRRLAAHANSEASTPSPPTAGSDGTDEVARLDELESDLEEKQAVAEAKRARMEAFQTLSESYADLAADLEPLDDPRAALDRVVDFEEDRDAPAYFEDRLTVLEAVAGSDG